jgi:ABC-type amino acid transport substrate-binding protein
MRLVRITECVLFAALGILAEQIGFCAPAIAADPGVLRVGVTANAPPMIFKEGSDFTGVEADLARAMGNALGRKVVFVEEKWENLIDALSDDRIDIIMSSMSITLPRSYRVAFSEPYLKVGQITLIRAQEKWDYAVNLAVQAKRGIGVKPGTIGDLLLQQELPRAKRKHFSSGDDGAKALLKKKIDLFVGDAPMIWYLAGQYEAKGLAVGPLQLSEEHLAWALPRSNHELLNQVNAFLRSARASGQLNQVLRRWIPALQ